ncbi:hypothetical protein M0R36_11310, partial [bacterium]|nr:hypothetical protein [bacterium]
KRLGIGTNSPQTALDVRGTIYLPGEEITVASKSKTRVYLKDSVGNYLIYQPEYWTGTAWATANNYGFGVYALQNNVGSYDVGFGSAALYNNAGSYDVGIGSAALQNNVGSYNAGFGSAALYNNAGSYNAGFGYNALQNNAGSYDVGFGYAALRYNVGSYDVGFGYAALYNNVGSYDVGFGSAALRYGQGNYNLAIGHEAWSSFLENVGGAKTFDYTAVDPATDRITVTAHGFGSTNAYVNLKYTQGTSAITGLTDGAIIQAKIIDANTVETTQTNNITVAGTGTGHTLTPQYSYSNTMVFGYGANPSASNQVVLGNDSVTQTLLKGDVYLAENYDLYIPAGKFAVTADASSTITVPSTGSSVALTLSNLEATNTSELLSLYNDATASTGYAIYLQGDQGDVDGVSPEIAWGHRIWTPGSLTVGRETASETRSFFRATRYVTTPESYQSRAIIRAESTDLTAYGEVLARVRDDLDTTFSAGIELNCTHGIYLSAGTDLNFTDQYRPGSGWSLLAGIPLSASSDEWDDIETLIGSEGSLFAAIIAASLTGGSGVADLQDAYDGGYAIVIDSNPVTITAPDECATYALALNANDTTNDMAALYVLTSVNCDGILVNCGTGGYALYLDGDSNNLFGVDSLGIYSNGTTYLESDTVLNVGAPKCNVWGITKLDLAATTAVDITTATLTVDVNSFILDTCVITADGSEINNVLHIDYGTEATPSTWSSGTVTANYATGKPMQTVTVDDDVTTVNITSPDGINGYSLLFASDELGSYNIPLSTFQKTGGGGTFIWAQGLTDNFDVGVVTGRRIEVLVTMEYRGSDTWYCSYTIMDLGAVA